MKIFVINLQRAAVRWGHMQILARKLGLEIQRVDAVDGKTLSVDQANKFRVERGNSHFLSNVEVACFLSHRKAWLEIVKRNEPFAAVLEDDLFISDCASQLLSSSDWIPAGCDVIKIETINRNVLLLPPSHLIDEGRKLWSIGSFNAGCGGYILSCKAATRLIDLTAKFCDPVDYFIFGNVGPINHKLNLFQMDPAICVQQVRTNTVFMNVNAGASQMDSYRGTTKKNVWLKLLRELIRPFRQFIRYSYFCFIALWKKGKYYTVKLH